MRRLKWKEAFARAARRADRGQHRIRYRCESLEQRLLLAVNNVSGDIPNGAVWAAGDIQRIVGDVRVPAGATLTIQPGAIIKFNEFQGLDLLVEGFINAKGTPGSRIIFTSLRDDSVGGDTGGDGNSSLFGGQWNAVHFSPGSSAIFEHAEFRYGGAGNLAQVLVNGAGVSIHDSIFRDSSSAGIRINAATPLLFNDAFRDNVGAALSMDLDSDPFITTPTFNNNTINGLALDGGTLSANRAWNDPDLVYLMTGTVTVPAGRVLSVTAGQVVKVAEFSGARLQIDGTLFADGTEQRPITFASSRDATIGGDTNNLGSNDAYEGQWPGIVLSNTSSQNILDHVRIRHAGAGISPLNISSSSTTITNGAIFDSASTAIRITASNPTLSNVRFEETIGAAITMDLASNPAITSPGFSNNLVNGLLLEGGDLPASNTWNDPDIVYWLSSPITVPAGRTLTIAPGQIIKFQEFAGVRLDVFGSLTADATATQPIIFTTTRDATVGGDTNNLGSNDAYVGQWNHVRFRPGSSANLDFVEMRYGGAGSSGTLIIESSAVNVTNSTFLFSAAAGARIENAKPTLASSRFQDNIGPALSMNLPSDPALSAITFTNNPVNGIFLDGGSLDASNKWDDPEVVYWLSATITVPQNIRLDIAPGQIIKFQEFAGVSLNINGTLVADASVEQPIIFTTTRDSTVGGDTNNLGSNDAYPGQWNAIHFGPTSTQSRLDQVQMRFGGAGNPAMLMIAANDLHVTNSQLDNASFHAIRITSANPLLAGNSFANNIGAAMSMDLASNPAITTPQFNNNAINGLALDPGDLPANAFWNDPDVTYWLTGTVRVPQTRSLDIAPGQIIKMQEFAGVSLVIDGILRAPGTPSRPIIFTTTRDATLGGDTNNLGSNDAYAGQWNGILFRSGSGSDVVKHVEVRYAGAGPDSAAVVADGANPILNAFLIRDSSTHGILARSNAIVHISTSIIRDNADNGLRSITGATLIAFNNTIDNNFRGAVTAETGSMQLANNLITFHHHAGVSRGAGTSLTVVNNDVFNPSRINYEGMPDQTGISSNISANPNYLNRESRLYELTASSPAIDAGTSNGAPPTDFLARTRVDDPGVPNTGSGTLPFYDLGAFERLGASPPPAPTVYPPLKTSFEAINFEEDATLSGNYHIPPDPHGVAGPNHVLNVVNTSIEWFTKSGLRQNRQRLGRGFGTVAGSFFAPLNPANNLFDPKVVYDQYAGRFLVTALERTDIARGDVANGSRILLAVSDDSDPNGTWHYHAIDSRVIIKGSETWADYPGFAVDEEAVYLTFAMFTFGSSASGRGERFWIVNKNSFYNGGAASVTRHDPRGSVGDLESGAYPMQIARMYGQAPGNLGTFLLDYFGLTNSQGNEFVRVIRVDNPLTNPTFTRTFVPVGNIDALGPAVHAPQSGSSALVQTNDNRMYDAVWRDNTLWAVTHVNPPTGPDAGQTTTHWFKIATTNLSSLTLADQGNIGGEEIAPGTHTFFPSISVNAAGAVGVGFAASGPNIFPGAYYTGRLATDPAGTMRPPGTLAAGQSYYTRRFGGSRNRWGDYSGLSLDPSDDATFWVYNEYAQARGTVLSDLPAEDGRWGTRWGSFNVGAAASAIPVPVADIVDIFPDPRTAPVDQISILFNVPVSGFDLSDLSLTRDGGPNLLGASQTLIATGERTYALGNLSPLTAAPGQYLLRLNATGTGIVGPGSQSLSATATDQWTVLPTSPFLSLADGDDIIRLTANPTTSTLTDISITNSSGTSNFTVSRASLVSEVIDTKNGNDTLILDFTLGSPLPSGLTKFEGGPGEDTLRILGIAPSDPLIVMRGFISHGSEVLSQNAESLLLENGTFRFVEDSKAPRVTLALAATAIFEARQHFSSLTINSGAVGRFASGKRLIRTAALSIASSSKLDLNDGVLVLTNGNLNLVRGYLSTGRNAPPGGAANANWNGPTGITSSAATAAFASSGSESRSIGYARNGDLLQPMSDILGEVLSASDVILRFTRNADFDLNGRIDDNDVSIVSGFYNPAHDPSGPVGPRLWSQGDLNDDGRVNDNDVSVVSGFYAPQELPIAPSSPSQPLLHSESPEKKIHPLFSDTTSVWT